MKRTRNLIVIALVLAAVVVAVVFGTRRGSQDVAVKTYTVKRTTFQTKLPENGVVQRPRVATIPTLVAGNIAQIYAKAGDYVRAGQVLATIENPTLESNAAGSQADYSSAVANIQTARVNEQNARVTYVAAVQTAKSNLDEAQRVYRADLNLYANKALPRNQLDSDKAKLDQMQVQYEQAQQQLRLGAVTGYGQNSVQYAQAAAQKAQIINASNQDQVAFTRIVAPFDGVIQTVTTQAGDPLTEMRPGDPVTQGQSLFTIASSGAYIVKAQVDEQDVINVRTGQQAIVSGQDFPGKQIAAHVAAIAPVATKSTDATSTAKQIVTTIQLDSSPPYLKDGMTVDVDILTANVHGALTVPNESIVSENGKSYVYAVRAGTAHKTAITTGLSNDSATIVKSGLAAGDKIVSPKVVTLTNGARVTAAPASSPSPSP